MKTTVYEVATISKGSVRESAIASFDACCARVVNEGRHRVKGVRNGI
jgi:hypothetical protein